MSTFIVGIVIGLVAGLIAVAVAEWAQSTVNNNPRCCEHNPCPSRPASRLRRFKNRPWRCVECGQWWRSKYEGTYEGGDFYWTKIEDAPKTDQWRADK